MIEIKHISGRVLYTAKNAPDVRAALVGAVGRGANLDGANLDGANLGDGVWTKVADALDVSIRAMNNGGAHWIKGSLRRVPEDGSAAYCSMGSVEAHSEGTTRTLTLWLLANVCGGDIVAFNDHENTTWEDVKAVFEIAAKHARRFAS